MLKIINHRVEDSVIKELLKSDYIDDFRDSIYYVEYKGKELYSFPFFNENNTINNHIIFHRGFRKVIYEKKDLSFWMKKSNVHFPKYLIISDRPENIVKYVSNKNHIFSRASYICFVPGVFNKEHFDYLNKNFSFEKIITLFSENSMNEILKLKTTLFLNDRYINIQKLNKGYLISYEHLKFEVENINYRYLRNRLELKIKVPITHKKNMLL